MEKIKRSAKVADEVVIGRIREKRALLNNILRRRANWNRHILKKTCLIYDAIEGQMTKVKKIIIIIIIKIIIIIIIIHCLTGQLV